ncbi:MAG: hypothetical protein H7Z43_02245 [Clostridia bacterium]|nr:hypothetical protein [Deltaproteobacteria bacterium]
MSFLQRVRSSSWVAALRSSESDNEPESIVLLATIVVLYVAWLTLMQGRWFWSGSMWAEMATNYYQNANSGSLIRRLLSTDAGYIPLPQRLIALVGRELRIPSSSIAYYYTGVSTVLTAVLAGAFTLRLYRPLIRNDLVRGCVALALLLMLDFETRTFINFTYIGVFTLAVTTVLAVVSPQTRVPLYLWLLPIFVMSKAYVLVVLPFMAIAALVAGKVMRRWLVVSMVIGLTQFVQLALSHSTDAAGAAAAHDSFAQKLLATTQYSGGFLAGFLMGPTPFRHLWPTASAGVIGLGLVLIIVLSTWMFARPGPHLVAPLVGAAMVVLNVLLNSFALTPFWNLDLARLDELRVYRHIFVAYAGVLLIAAFMVEQIANLIAHRLRLYGRLAALLPSVLFIGWGAASGWADRGQNLNRAPSAPMVDVSMWQEMSRAVDAGMTPLCVPIDPFGWIYGRKCSVLNPGKNWLTPIVYEKRRTVTALIPSEVGRQELLAAAFVVKPQKTYRSRVHGVAVLATAAGPSRSFIAEHHVEPSGGIIFFDMTKNGVRDSQSVDVTFDEELDIAFSDGQPLVSWMGHD